MFRVSHHGVVYRDSRFMSAFPAITRTQRGQLLVVFRRAPDHRWLLASTYDGSKLTQEDNEALRECIYHWDPRSQLVSVTLDQDMSVQTAPYGLSVDAQSADQDASLITLADNTILLASFSWYPMPPAFAALTTAWRSKAYGGPQNTGCSYLPWGTYTRRSNDAGKTWSDRQYLPPLPEAEDLVPGLRPAHGGGCRGQIVQRGEELLLATYERVPALGPAHAAHLYASNDGGLSWSYRSVIAHDSTGKLAFLEPCLCLCADGSVLAWMRTSDAKDRLATTRSTDGGHTWKPFVLHQTIGHPAHALVLNSGRVLLTYGYRHPGFGVRARLLNELGTNVDQAPELVIRDDGPHADVGYPWACELEDGRVAVVYYFSDENGCRHIAYTILSPDRQP